MNVAWSIASPHFLCVAMLECIYQKHGDYAVKPSYITFKCFNYSTTKFVNKEIFAVSKLRLFSWKQNWIICCMFFWFSCVYLSDICNYTEHLSFSIHWQFQVQGPTMVPTFLMNMEIFIYLIISNVLTRKRGICIPICNF